MNPRAGSDLDEALQRAARLQEMGIAIRSSELSERAKTVNEFVTNGGNRAMRRAAARAKRRR